ncbi:hypothetical protein BU15DRAFT_31524, partial [Melanogaster broomeanus]
NILIDRFGRARLADFGLSIILLEFVGGAFFHLICQGEHTMGRSRNCFCFLDNSTTVPVPCQASDMYSFGSVMFQVLTGEVPYSHLKSDAQVIFTVSKEVTPSSQDTTSGRDSEPHWKFIHQCWSKCQTARPTS